MMTTRQNITISADDFGLSRSITDTILETVDAGPVRLVSVIANGEAVEYALAQYRSRSPLLQLAVHLNLTEGKALLAPKDIPHLATAEGKFKHSVGGLWFFYLCSSSATRRALRTEVRAEFNAQVNRIRTLLGTGESVVVNGHQHVHMIPFVFQELIALGHIRAIRIVDERIFFAGIPSLVNLCAVLLLSWFAPNAKILAREAGVETNDTFIGLLYSGHMNAARVKKGIAHAGLGTVEILFHPGSAATGELSDSSWKSADLSWHRSVWRAHEREMLKKNSGLFYENRLYLADVPE